MRALVFAALLLLGTVWADPGNNGRHRPFGHTLELSDRISELQQRLDALEQQPSNTSQQPPRYAFFFDSTCELCSIRVVHTEEINELATNTGVPSGYALAIRVNSRNVGLFVAEQDALAYRSAFVEWLRQGGSQPTPEDFGGISIWG